MKWLAGLKGHINITNTRMRMTQMPPPIYQSTQRLPGMFRCDSHLWKQSKESGIDT